MYYCEYAHLLKKHTEHTCMSAIYYDQGSNVKAKQCKTIITFDTILESKILDASDLLILSNLQKPWTIACKDISRVFEIEYSTYCILNRLELCECSLTTGNYLLSYTNINWKCTRSKTQLLHYILFLQQDNTGHHHKKIQHPGR